MRLKHFRTGSINLRNLRRVARELGENMSDEELRAMIDEFDTSGTGESKFIVFVLLNNWCLIRYYLLNLYKLLCY